MTFRSQTGLHIVLVTPGFPADEDETSCLPYLQVFLREAVRRGGLRFSVVALHHPARRTPFRWHGLPVTPVAGGLPWTGLVRAARAIREIHRRDGVDLVHGLWLTDAALVASMTARSIRRPVVLSAMGQDAAGNSGWTRLLPLRHAVVTTPSLRAAERFETTFGRPANVVVPWGVEAQTEPLASWDRRDVDLLGVGSLVPVKCWEDFLVVAAHVLDDDPSRTVVLVGDGPDKGRLRELAERRGLADRVHFSGAVSRAEALAWMGRSRVLVHPSRYEGFGMAPVEALASGAVVVSRPVGVAGAGPRWRVGVTAGELMRHATAVLTEAPAVGGERPWPVEDTVVRWHELYRMVAQ